MKLYTIREVADILGVNHYTIYDWVYANHIEYVRIGPNGRSIRITEKAVAAYIERNTTTVG
jgi:excisionase family DNA binding protein